jgi:hypothetical protein
MRGHDLKGIGNRDDARPKWNRLPLQSCGIASAIPVFMVVRDDVGDLGWHPHLPENHCTVGGMSLDMHKLLLRQARGFLEHRSGDGKFPDVMQQRRPFDHIHRPLVIFPFASLPPTGAAVVMQ